MDYSNETKWAMVGGLINCAVFLGILTAGGIAFDCRPVVACALASCAVAVLSYILLSVGQRLAGDIVALASQAIAVGGGILLFMRLIGA